MEKSATTKSEKQSNQGGKKLFNDHFKVDLVDADN